tara:strand:+ start:109 stop:903 length:795 start_codon:yes stop_codon:yes gene_type:complete
MKKCQFHSKNTCQPEGAAGHKGAIRTLKNKQCAKKISSVKDKELRFYQRNCPPRKRKKKICTFLPKFSGTCQGPQKLRYIQLENLTKSMKQPCIMDIKIGKETASEHELRGKKKHSLKKRIGFKLKKSRHNLLDRLTTSHHHGFRIESATNVTFSKMKLMHTSPHTVFRRFFKSNIIRKHVIRQIEKIHTFAMSKQFDEYSFIGSSILIIYDCASLRRSPKVAMIDFAHARQSRRMTRDEKKFRQLYRQGLTKLLYTLRKGLKD